MDGAGRQPNPDLIGDLVDNPKGYSFFQAIELLMKQFDRHVEERALQPQALDNVILRVDPGLGFPSSDVADVDLIAGTDITDPNAVLQMTVNFLGLHGSSSPLPSDMVHTAQWSKGEQGVQVAFNDFFSNRLIWFLYLIWRKYRYYLRYRPGATDQFSDWMFSLIGIGGKDSRGTADIPWAKLLAYLGMVAARVRSNEAVAGVIAHAFGLEEVSIRELELRKVEIPKDQRASFGIGNTTLGEDFLIGRYKRDRAGKFTVVLSNLKFERIRDFLPSGRDYPRLKELVEFLLKDQFAYDIELHLAEREVPKFELGVEHRANIGWTTFIGNTEREGLKPIVLQARA